MKRIIVMIIVITLLTACGRQVQEEHFEWNNGKCSECGGELIWQGTGSKEHYKCKRCGKEYRFDKVMDKGGCNDIHD